MIKAIIGMIKWKIRMKKLEKETVYSEKWWKEVQESVLFLPENQRKGFVDSFISTMVQF